MSIAILYESDEWSNLYLRDRLLAMGLDIVFFDLEEETLDETRFAGVELIVNRLYPSAFFRGNERTYFHGLAFVEKLQSLGIPMLNPWQAMLYDFSKSLVCSALLSQGIPTPRVYCHSHDFALSAIHYPCIVKPNCGGRATWTHVIHDEVSLLSLMNDLPPIEFIYQEFIPSIVPFTLRVEVIDGKVFSAVTRTLDASGISGLHRGSEFAVVEALDPAIQELILRTLSVLEVRMGGIDVVIGEDGPYIIDVNATSNFSQRVVALLGRNPLDQMAEFICREYREIQKQALRP